MRETFKERALGGLGCCRLWLVESVTTLPLIPVGAVFRSPLRTPSFWRRPESRGRLSAPALGEIPGTSFRQCTGNVLSAYCGWLISAVILYSIYKRRSLQAEYFPHFGGYLRSISRVCPDTPEKVNVWNINVPH